MTRRRVNPQIEAADIVAHLVGRSTYSHRWSPMKAVGQAILAPSEWQGWPPRAPDHLATTPQSQWTAEQLREYVEHMANEGTRMFTALVLAEIELEQERCKHSRSKPVAPKPRRVKASTEQLIGIMGPPRDKGGRPRGSSALGFARKALLLQRLSPDKLNDRQALERVLKDERVRKDKLPVEVSTILNVMTQQRKSFRKT